MAAKLLPVAIIVAAAHGIPFNPLASKAPTNIPGQIRNPQRTSRPRAKPAGGHIEATTWWTVAR